MRIHFPTYFPRFRDPLRNLLLVVLLGLSPACADEFLLGSLGKMTGSLVSIDSSSHLSLTSPLSPNTLDLPITALESLIFPATESNRLAPPQLLQLVNGDQLPVEIIELDATSLRYRPSWQASLQIPRSAMLSLHFDAANPQILYSGPKQDDWQLNKAWKFQADQLVSLSWGPTHRKFESLPDRYVIDFEVAWTGNAGFKFLFASNTPDGNNDTNAYFLQFNSAGLELKRQIAQPRKYLSLATFNDLTPDQFEDSSIKFTLRVDRANRLLQLALNGKDLRRTIIDPQETGPIPSGSFFSFLATTGQDDEHRISKIQLSTWPSGSVEARQEKRPATDRDTLYDIDSNRISGKLLSIQAGKPSSILFENPHDPSPQPLPSTQVAVIHLHQTLQPITTPCYRIELRNQGILHLSEFTLREGQLQATHPLLGPLTIPRDHILSLKKFQP
jgi:hypothetical protein